MISAPRLVNWDKHCFIYCGPGVCNCADSATPFDHEQHEKELLAQAEMLRAARVAKMERLRSDGKHDEALVIALTLCDVASRPTQVEIRLSNEPHIRQLQIDELKRQGRDAEAFALALEPQPEEKQT
jgi:hypothetical protein